MGRDLMSTRRRIIWASAIVIIGALLALDRNDVYPSWVVIGPVCLGIAGIAPAGRQETTFRMVEGLLDAADRSDGRLPELFLGLARDDVGIPVP